MKAATVKEGLIATKWIIEKYGWCQGYYQVDAEGNSVFDPITEPFCGSCLGGAIDLVEYEDCSVANAIYDKVFAAINYENINIGSIPHWNDAPQRTKKQVIALLNGLIAKAK